MRKSSRAGTVAMGNATETKLDPKTLALARAVVK